MDWKELRYGNKVYVDWRDAGRKIETCWGIYRLPANCMLGWDNNGWRMNTLEMGYPVHVEIVNPILLSRDWIDKAGYEIDALHDCYVLFQGDCFAIEYFIEENEIHLVGQSMTDKLPIEFVHQFQNFMFDLTKKEIEFKN